MMDANRTMRSVHGILAEAGQRRRGGHVSMQPPQGTDAPDGQSAHVANLLIRDGETGILDGQSGRQCADVHTYLADLHMEDYGLDMSRHIPDVHAVLSGHSALLEPGLAEQHEEA